LAGAFALLTSWVFFFVRNIGLLVKIIKASTLKVIKPDSNCKRIKKQLASEDIIQAIPIKDLILFL
jgi:hypothetical protein